MKVLHKEAHFDDEGLNVDSSFVVDFNQLMFRYANTVFKDRESIQEHLDDAARYLAQVFASAVPAGFAHKFSSSQRTSFEKSLVTHLKTFL